MEETGNGYRTGLQMSFRQAAFRKRPRLDARVLFVNSLVLAIIGTKRVLKRTDETSRTSLGR